MKKLSLILLISFAGAKTFAQTNIEAKDAAKHIGEKVTICDKVFGGKFLAGSSITLLDLGGAHPSEFLTILIKGDDRKKFKDAPETMYRNKNVCVTGMIINYKGKPEIAISDTTQIKIAAK